MRTVPGYREARDLCENQAWRASLAGVAGRTGCTVIPCVVHVVHKTNAQNISDAQINSQIDVLNEDFRKKNADVTTAPAPFQPLADDARIQFELATKDPDGNPTDGILRVPTNVNAFSSNDDVKDSAQGGSDAWPADKYLNIWVCQLGGGLLGYAQFPGGPADTDGVVILHSAFGTVGTASAPFDQGRTTTHEIGHWLNLRHIWGDDGNGCSGTDFVADTPNQGGPNLGKPSFPSVSCGNAPNGDMYCNYMDYVDDDTMVMFSAGQVVRMQATLDGVRSTIGRSIPCGVKPLPKDLGKDGPKDPLKDPLKDGPKDWPKDPPKDWPKDPPKDWPKDPPKDFPKDGPKDFPKDIIKELPKEFHKELHKDFPFDPGPKLRDPGPKLSDPGPKLDPGPKVFDPGPKLRDPGPKLDPGPKQLDPGPKGFDPGPKLSDPGPFPGPFGGTPFVLATPSAGRGDCGCGPGSGSDNAALVAHYQQLLSQYAQLAAEGRLDQAGYAQWQQIAEAYRQLTGGY